MSDPDSILVTISGPDQDFVDTLFIEIHDIYCKLRTLVALKICVQSASSNIAFASGRGVAEIKETKTIISVENPATSSKGHIELMGYMKLGIQKLKKDKGYDCQLNW